MTLGFKSLKPIPELTVMQLCDFYAWPGGLAKAVQILVHSLSRHGIRNLVFVPGLTFKIFYDRDTQVFVLPCISHLLQQHRRVRYTLPICDPFFILSMLIVLRKYKVSLIHAHGWVVYSAFWIKVLKRIPLVYSAHDYGTFCIRRSLYQSERASFCPKIGSTSLPVPNRACMSCAIALNFLVRGLLIFALRIQRPLLRLLDCTFAMSTYMADTLKSIGERNVIRIITPTSYEELNLSQFAGTTEPFDLVYFGALSQYKGADLFVSAVRLLKEHGYEYRTCMIGSAGDMKMKPLSGLTVITNATRAEIASVLTSAKCIVFPSCWPEPAIPLTLLECLTVNQSVIVSDRGGTADATRYGALSFKSGDVHSLATEISNFMEQQKKPMEVQRGISNDCELSVRIVLFTYETYACRSFRLLS